MWLARLAERTLGDVLIPLDGKEARDALGQAFPLGCRWGVPWSGSLDVKPGVINGELDDLSV
jgi:hypothetical protein